MRILSIVSSLQFLPGAVWMVSILGAVCAQEAMAKPVRVLPLTKILGGRPACALGGRSSVSFLTEDTILLLSGPNDSCYRDLDDLRLVVLSLDGTIRASKAWHSTYPLVVLSGGRIVTFEKSLIRVLDADLQPLQTLDLPQEREWSTIYLSSLNADTLIVRSSGGTTRVFKGDPLTRIRDERPTFSNGNTVIAREIDGSEIAYSSKKLLRTSTFGPPEELASLSWVNPCLGITCQEYEAGVTYQLSSGPKRRVVFATNGSRFPVTDAAGIFPYFRVEVFEVANGAEIFRKEFIFRTAVRSASISPNGEMLLMSDGREAVLEHLP